MPVDEEVARAYGRTYSAMAAAGSKPRGRRAFDLLIAATALASGLPLYTRNPSDFTDLGDQLEVVAVPVRGRSNAGRREAPSLQSGRL